MRKGREGKKNGNTAAEGRARVWKGGAGNASIYGKGRGLVTSQSAVPPRKRGGARLRPGEEGGGGRERGMAWCERKGAGRSDPAVQVLTAWQLLALPRTAAPRAGARLSARWLDSNALLSSDPAPWAPRSR